MLPKYGEPRLKFPSGEQRNFINSFIKRSGLNIAGVANLVGVSERTIRDWINEDFCITDKALLVLCDLCDLPVPPNRKRMISEWMAIKKRNSRMGALARFEKYGELATQEGRKKGGIAAIKIMRRKGVIPLPKKFIYPKSYSSELAEWVGILLGDGSITNFGQVNISLNMTKDADYLVYVAGLGEKLFGERPRVFYRRIENCSKVYYSGVNLVKYLLKIGMKTGDKVRQQVGVPGWIKKNPDFSTACLRGLVDTDGHIATHRYVVNGKTYKYKKLVFSNRSLPLIKFVYNHFNRLELGPKIVDTMETNSVWLYNSTQTRKYLDIVGSHNTRILMQGG